MCVCAAITVKRNFWVCFIDKNIPFHGPRFLYARAHFVFANRLLCAISIDGSECMCLCETNISRVCLVALCVATESVLACWRPSFWLLCVRGHPVRACRATIA